MSAIEQLEALMKSLGLTQSALAAKLNVNVQQLKDIQRGKIKKLPEGICEALVDVFHVNPEWLIKKTGPIFTEVQRGNLVRKATDAAVEVALRYTPISPGLLLELQTAAFEDGLSAEDLMSRFESRLPRPLLTPDEVALLDNYRSAEEEDKHAIERMADLAARARKKSRKT